MRRRNGYERGRGRYKRVGQVDSDKSPMLLFSLCPWLLECFQLDTVSTPSVSCMNPRWTSVKSFIFTYCWMDLWAFWSCVLIARHLLFVRTLRASFPAFTGSFTLLLSVLGFFRCMLSKSHTRRRMNRPQHPLLARTNQQFVLDCFGRLWPSIACRFSLANSLVCSIGVAPSISVSLAALGVEETLPSALRMYFSTRFLACHTPIFAGISEN